MGKMARWRKYKPTWYPPNHSFAFPRLPKPISPGYLLESSPLPTFKKLEAPSHLGSLESPHRLGRKAWNGAEQGQEQPLSVSIFSEVKSLDSFIIAPVAIAPVPDSSFASTRVPFGCRITSWGTKSHLSLSPSVPISPHPAPPEQFPSTRETE